MCCKSEADEELNWVVRLCLRTNEDKWYFIDGSANVNARLSSAMKMKKDVAMQLAEAINNGNIKYLATARRLYSDGKLWHKTESGKEENNDIAK